MTQKTKIKYLTINLICLILFGRIKHLYNASEITIDILYSTPSLFGAICLTSIPIPLLVYINRGKDFIFLCYVFFSTFILFFDEYKTILSRNEYFDSMDIFGIVVGALITLLLFYSDVKCMNHDRK